MLGIQFCQTVFSLGVLTCNCYKLEWLSTVWISKSRSIIFSNYSAWLNICSAKLNNSRKRYFEILKFEPLIATRIPPWFWVKKLQCLFKISFWKSLKKMFWFILNVLKLYNSFLISFDRINSFSTKLIAFKTKFLFKPPWGLSSVSFRCLKII